MARYLLTGATGFIGSELVPALHDAGHQLTLLTRQPEKRRRAIPDDVELIDDLAAITTDTHFDGVINLAGEGIADKRWTAARKRELMDSRVQVTQALGQLLERLEHRPEVIISGSAVGYYGAQESEEGLHEDAEPVREFSHELCAAWEEAARQMAPEGSRLCIIRLGVVLGPDGGMLQRLELPFKLGLGGRLGHGRQMLSWVHRRDVVRGIQFLLDSAACQGIYNLTAPLPVSNREFTRALAAALHRPAIFPLPAPVLKLAFGEMGDRLLLNGQAVIPLRLNRAGFIFDFEEIDAALADIFDVSR